jgi:hypothetical protein
MTRARSGVHQGPLRHREPVSRLGAQRRQFRPQGGQQPQAWTDLYDRLQQHTAEIAPENSPALRHRRRPRAQQPPRRGDLPAQYRPGLHAQSRAGRKVERITAEEVRATGIQWAFAPCVTVPQDARWGRTYEGFSEDPQLVSELAGPAVRGLQGNDLRIRWPCWPAPSISSATAARHSGREPQRRSRATTRAIRASTKPRCAASICRATSRHSKPASARSCRRTAVGTASRSRATSTCSPTSSRRTGLRRLPDFRLQRRRPDRPRITRKPSASPSTPAWTW